MVGRQVYHPYKQVSIKQDIPLDSVVMRLSERSVGLIIHKRRYGSDGAV